MADTTNSQPGGAIGGAMQRGQFTSLARVGPVQADAAPGYVQPQQITNEQQITSLSAYVEGCYERAKVAKQLITERLLRCDRQRAGEYDPEKLVEIRAEGGSEVFLMLTAIKCNAADSWIKDVMLNAGDQSWTMEPTPIPSLPQGIREQIIEMVSMEAQMAQQQGVQVTREVIAVRMRELHEQIREEMKAEAQRAADNMSQQIGDILTEANWPDTLSDVITDFTTFPAAFVEGPIFRRKKVMEWGAGWKVNVVEKVVEEFDRISPYDVFPSPQAKNEQEGYLCIRVRTSLGGLSDLIGMPGYKASEIMSVMEQYRSHGLRNLSYGETERDRLAGRIPWYDTNEVIEGVKFWGDIPGMLLKEWGVPNVEESKVYPACVVKYGNHVVFAQLNPTPLGKRPVHRMCWDTVPGAFWGRALPEKMRDTQMMCNQSARALANNVGVASGPQVEVTVDRLPTGENITKMFPWKIWQTTSDRTGGGQPAIRFFQPQMNAQELLGVLQYFIKIADEVTGIPNYVYGSGASGGAGRTSSGLSMLLENASKGIRQSIMNIDRGFRGLLTMLYTHLMIHSTDESIKGDMNAVPAGMVGALVMDHLQERRQQFLQLTSNPVDTQIMGAKGRAALLRQLARGLKMNISEIIPPDEVIEQAMQSGQVPPQVMEEMQQLQEEVMQLTAQVQDKSEENQIRREEIEARIEEAHIRSQALVDSRIHESELRAQVESKARLKEAEIRRETELEKIRAQRDETGAANGARRQIESMMAPLVKQLDQLRMEMKMRDKESKPAPEGPVHINVQDGNEESGKAITKAVEEMTKAATANGGNVDVEFKRDASGKLTGMTVKRKPK